MKKKLMILLTIAFTMILSGCSKWIDQGESVTAVGSSALQPLVETVAEEFQQDRPGQFVNVQGGGSGTGLSQVQSGAVDIGNSDMFAEEKDGIDASQLVDHRVAVIGITPIINKEVGVKNLSKDELKQIFLGEITNWKELGGENQDIVILNRASGSGTRDTFEKWILDDENAVSAQEQDSSGMVRQIVSDTPGAISYIAFSYVTNDVDTLSIDNVEPTDENVTTNDWPIWSYEHMYTNGEPKGLTKEFLDYTLSEEIQKNLVGELGYIPVSQMEVERDANGDIVE
ncbi:putative phosphate ABC transporter phosphate-binding protein [Tetragenococcus halophilus subsp. halophilus]|uniref:phosphate ABC transporter substrate-binding protein PstS n=2 Tax=Tetragenococcus halophilus TaxID=51669 RepID=UPI00077C8CB1|nr:phosphate ABC transporter substrate-binding protein PstS [Tetragenococcus halophilus]AOF49123.1 phosphate ABC transporter substrate-binding protein [Tetragenococcus halophilus]MCT8310177.1 phosphate ABC transporter substrate-binding protein PstS [Tetragenococcus halophilus]MDN6130025.1 phosphate ABC transporter substrate-binding protein PstS [Tetragenococcus halophilus]MDN6203458.1 phosphate ABC transporter substrate-binding protein PstS [Tetragenococcus halophilus]MDN6507715.1 phosphate AB